MIEAFACGTPVVAFARGSVKEFEQEGVNGVIVNGVEKAVAILESAMALPRNVIRTSFEKRFSACVMARNYVEIYERLRAAQGAVARKAA